MKLPVSWFHLDIVKYLLSQGTPVNQTNSTDIDILHAYSNSPVQHMKYVDDLTLIESRRITQQTRIQDALDDMNEWTRNNNMKLNPSKCTTMIITFCKNPPQRETLSIADVELSAVTEAKLLGVVLQSNLKWDSHVTHVIKKCNRKLYMLRSLKRFNIPVTDLVTVYSVYIRPEYGCPVFNGSLTKKQESQQ